MICSFMTHICHILFYVSMVYKLAMNWNDKLTDLNDLLDHFITNLYVIQ